MVKLINHFKRYRFVLSELVKKGITLRYRRSYLGVFWTMLEPLLNMFVLYFVFGFLYHKGGTNGYGGLNFMVYILSGRLVYTYFNQSTKECTRIIRSNAALIKKVHIPKYLFPLSFSLHIFSSKRSKKEGSSSKINTLYVIIIYITACVFYCFVAKFF